MAATGHCRLAVAQCELEFLWWCYLVRVPLTLRICDSPSTTMHVTRSPPGTPCPPPYLQWVLCAKVNRLRSQVLGVQQVPTAASPRPSRRKQRRLRGGPRRRVSVQLLVVGLSLEVADSTTTDYCMSDSGCA